eukprot:gene26312-66369_t
MAVAVTAAVACAVAAVLLYRQWALEVEVRGIGAGANGDGTRGPCPRKGAGDPAGGRAPPRRAAP